MSVLEEYWAGALTRVNAEVHTFSRLIQHNGQMGSENESIFGRLLERLLPRRYGLGTGMVIDSFDTYSRQTDLVIYDRADLPTLFAQSTELIYAVEAVTAAIEVKTRLGHGDIASIGRNLSQLRALKPYGNECDTTKYDGGLPYCAVLAYSSRVAPTSIRERFEELSIDKWPDLMCVIDCGFLMCRNGELEGSEPGTLFAGVTLEHTRDISGNRNSGLYREATGDEDFHTVDDKHYTIEPARALLLFLQALNAALGMRKSPRVDMMGLYLRAPVTQVETV